MRYVSTDIEQRSKERSGSVRVPKGEGVYLRVRVESCSFLILRRRSRVIGPQLFRSTCIKRSQSTDNGVRAFSVHECYSKCRIPLCLSTACCLCRHSSRLELMVGCNPRRFQRSGYIWARLKMGSNKRVRAASINPSAQIHSISGGERV